MRTTYVDLNDNLARRTLPAPAKGQVFYYDARTKGLALRVTANGARAWVVVHWSATRRRTMRFVLGDARSVSTSDARKAVTARLGAVAIGKQDPFEREARRRSEITLKKVLEDYLGSRDLKPRTVRDYRIRVEGEAFKDWLSKPIESITRDDVERKHKKLSQASPARANGAMVVLRALINFAIGRYEVDGRPLFTDNPVKRLSATRSWNKVRRRHTAIPLALMPDWFRAARDLNTIASDYLQMIALTGLRRGEAANLTWKSIDFRSGTFVIEDTKNRDPLHLPITQQLAAILERRKRENSSAAVRSVYVFPANGLDAPINEPRKSLDRICASIDYPSTVHDLRRSFINAADESGLPFMIVKMLVNHRLPNENDGVTMGYATADGSRMRAAAQRIADILDGTVRTGQITLLSNSI